MPELVKGSRSNGQQLAMEKAIESNSNGKIILVQNCIQLFELILLNHE